MKALFFTSNYYESPFQVGDHHLARSFAADGWEVGFISTPITPFHIFSNQKKTLKERYLNHQNHGQEYNVGKGKILSYVPGALAAPRRIPFLNSRVFSNLWPRLTRPSLKTWLNDHDFSEVDLIYFSSSLYEPWLKEIPHQQSVFRIMDQETGYRHFTKQDEFRRRQLAQTVDLVIFSAFSLETIVRSLHPKQTLHLPNGVDLENFLDKNPDEPEEYQPLTNPIVVYVGAMSYWFDHKLINQLAEALPEVEFVLIGPKAEIQKTLHPRSNLHLLGRQPHKDLAKYLYHANLGIIPFNRERYPELVNAINPLKLYEFAACGLPIVATRWDELERINPPAQLCDSKEDFVSTIQQALAQPPDPQIQIDFARQYDWSLQYQKLIQKLHDLRTEQL